MLLYTCVIIKTGEPLVRNEDERAIISEELLINGLINCSA